MYPLTIKFLESGRIVLWLTFDPYLKINGNKKIILKINGLTLSQSVSQKGGAESKNQVYLRE